MDGSSRILLASQRDSQNNKLAQSINSSAASGAEHKQSTPSTPSKATRQDQANNKENMTARAPMASAIPTRLQHNGSSEPTVAQLLAQSPAHLHTRGAVVEGENREPSSNNVAIASWRKGQGFKAWESELLKSAEVRRKADVAQLCKSKSRVYMKRLLISFHRDAAIRYKVFLEYIFITTLR